MIDDVLFRRESARLVAALVRVFGVHNLALAEDVAQDALCRAVETWAVNGRPENPSAWLMTTAKNQAIGVFRKEKTARTYAPDLEQLVTSEWTLAPTVEKMFDDNAIKDDELRMIFTICHPKVPEEAQVALALNISCGFSAGEIASAFLVSTAAIEKRLARGKKALAASPSLFDLTVDASFSGRLKAVQRVIYLLFNEGFHGANPEAAVRKELCAEAMHLGAMLGANARAATPTTFALRALMCLHAARLPTKVDDAQNLTPLFAQDRSKWDHRLVDEGVALLDEAATGPHLDEIHLEAAIAAMHAVAESTTTTDWASIVWLYDQLLELRPSPVVALQRAIAIAEARGPQYGLEEIYAIENAERLTSYPFYYAALGELELRCGQRDRAQAHFERAKAVSRNDTERRFFDKRVAATGPS
ncbi:MAG TPA: DUF6596 domain-containing protein [Polyangiaceae bacterium]